MILRTLLLCMGSALAAPTLEPHIPKTIDCPNSDIHVYINATSVDRSEYTFVDWTATNLQDCVEKCFGNHFCYSIRFDAAIEKNCALYYFAAYNCSNQALTKASTIEYKGGSITLDCIRCPGRGDFVTAPPFSSVGEQTIVSETAVLSRGKNIKGVATEITHNSENEGKKHDESEGGESKDQQGDEVKKTEGEGKGEIEGSGEEKKTEGEASPEAGAGAGVVAENEAGASTESTLSRAGADGTESAAAGATPAEGAETSSAGPSEAEAGSTLLPAGDEAESSTLEGSGEAESEEEATTAIAGAAEEEATIEASGEGSASAPGFAPSDRGAHVEGSGTEGAGPAISAQEEEEPVKVDVETTTVWSGHTDQPRVCSGSLRFVPSANVDLDTVQLLINSTKANSPAECAKVCYEHNCGFAYYEPSTFVCSFMANTEDLVDKATCPADLKDVKYAAEFRTDVASTMTCVVCAKESEVAKPALPPVASPRQGRPYPACIISFQAAEGDHSSFPFYKSIQVRGANECARHCFIGECSQAVYNPKSKECRLGSNPKDTCNNLPLVHKLAVIPSEEVLLQCFRCVPEELLDVKGSVSETTANREPSSGGAAAESIDEAAASAAAKEKEESAAAAAKAAEEEAKTSTAQPETTSEETTAAATTADAEEAETTTIAGSGAEVELAEPLPVGVTEQPLLEESTVATTTTAAEAETTPLGGEEVELEEASGEGESSSTASPEILDYSSTAASSESSTAAEGAAETATAPDGELPATTTVEVEEGSGETEGTLAREGASNADADSSTAAAAGAAADEKAAAAAAGEEQATTTAAAEGAESAATTETAAAESSTTGAAEATTEGGAEATSAAGEAAAEATTAADGEEVSSTLSPSEQATSEGPGEMSKAIEANDQPLILASEDIDFGKSCVIKFQAAPFSSRPASLTAPFEKAFPVDSIELCATRCFQDGCSGAKYEPESKTCHLAYEDKPSCDRSELHLRMKEVTGETWLHCVNCYPEKSVVKSVLTGAPLDKSGAADEKKPEAEKSMLDKVIGAVSEVASTVTEKVTGESAAAPDNVLNHGCIVNFQSSPSSEMPADSIEFLPPFKTRYAHRCATKCFQEGCAAATFDPSSSECSLGFGRFLKCANSPLVTTALALKEKTTIHCMSCIHHKSGDGGVDLVVLSPDDARIHLSESQDIPAEEAEGASGAAAAAPVVESTTIAVSEGGAATTEASSSTAAGEGSSTAAGEEAAGGSSSVAPEVNGGSLGKEGGEISLSSGEGKIAEVPLDTEGVRIPSGVNLEEAEGILGRVQVSGEKKGGEATGGKFKVDLPNAGFNIDSGVGKVNVDGKMSGDVGAGAGEKDASGAAATGESSSTTAPEGAATGSSAAEEEAAITASATADEESTSAATAASSSESTPAAAATGEAEASSTPATAAEGSSTPAAEAGAVEDSSTPAAATAADGSSTPAADAASTAGGASHGTIHPAKELETQPLPNGSEPEATTTSEGAEGSTATGGENGDRKEEEEAPAFVQGSADEEGDEEEKEASVAAGSIDHREGLLEKALATANPKATESTTAQSTDGSSTVAGESTVSSGGASESTVTPVEGSTAESSTAAAAAAEGSTAGSADSSTAAAPAAAGNADGESATAAAPAAADELAAATAATESSTISSDAPSTTAATTADLQHREGLLEKALAAANPALTTKAADEGAAATSTAASSDTTASSTSAPSEAISSSGSTVPSTEESSTAAAGEESVAASTVSTDEAGSSTVSPSSAADESSTVAVTEGTVVPSIGGGGPDGTAMAASIDEKTKEEEGKVVDEEMAQKGEVQATTGTKGAASVNFSTTAASADSADSSSTVSSVDSTASSSTVPSPADLAKTVHQENGGAEFGQTGQRGSSGGEEKGAAAGAAAAGASAESSSTSAEGLAREQIAEASTAAGEESSSSSSTAESTATESSDGSSTASSSDGAESSSSISSSGIEISESSSTPEAESASESSSPASSSLDSESLLKKALATAHPAFTTEIGGEHAIPTTAVPSPADLAKQIHQEHGGAEFGQTGQRGDGKGSATSAVTSGEQEDEIKATTISAVEASTANGESLDGGVERALSAVGGVKEEAKTTTEPPVQAVKDLLDALASGDFDRALLGKKGNGTSGTAADKLLKGQTQITDVATPVNQKHEGQTFFEHDHNVDITTLHAIDDSVVTVPSPQGVSKGCDAGRIEFQYVPAGSLPRLNVTNDVPARTPADCARKCHETKGCTTAGFIPTPSAEIANGVCLLTSDDEVCISRDDAVPQHASITAFVISCIRCTKCSYTLSHTSLSSSTAKFAQISTVTTIGECAQVCHDKKCVFAQYDATTSTCALSMEASAESGCRKVEPALAVKGAFPVRLECVQCKE